MDENKYAYCGIEFLPQSALCRYIITSCTSRLRLTFHDNMFIYRYTTLYYSPKFRTRRS